LEAHEIVIRGVRAAAKAAADQGDDGTNDLLVSNVLRTNEFQVMVPIGAPGRLAACACRMRIASRTIKGERIMDDAQIKRDLEAELAWEPSVNAAGIGVAVNSGLVTLTGHVANFPEKWAAERAAARVAGVAAVASELEVRLGSSSERTDEDIARSALNSLNWNVSVPSYAIQVQVSHGWVTLAGTVDWRYQKKAAVRAVRNLIGVRGVSNLITVRPTVSAGSVKADIEAALRRSAEVDAARITVETNGDKVTLRGSVRSWMERQEAERAAWAAPGVGQVEDLITVTP
jgi:osmotically-inducible protein OsmY